MPISSTGLLCITSSCAEMPNPNPYAYTAENTFPGQEQQQNAVVVGMLCFHLAPRHSVAFPKLANDLFYYINL